MKHLPNCITMSRIVLTICLIPIQSFSRAFFVIYSCCGVSDVLDGALARVLRCSNDKGAKLDSIADLYVRNITLIGNIIFLIIKVNKKFLPFC